MCMVHFHSSISGIGRRKCSEHGWLHPLGWAIFSQPRWQQGSVAAWTCPSSSTRPVGAPFTKCRIFRAFKQAVTLNPLFIDHFLKGTMGFPHLFACLPQGTVGLYLCEHELWRFYDISSGYNLGLHGITWANRRNRYPAEGDDVLLSS